ncbi:MAG: hypothetical protein ABIK92_10395 [Pseudomonadota bacterium]
MKEEKAKETKEEIMVLDEGIDVDDTVDMGIMCCSGALAPFR